MFHIPNGINAGRNKGAQLNKAGLLSGIPDLLAILPGMRLVWIEMKKLKGGTVSGTQKIVHRFLSLLGFEVIVGHGAKETLQKFWDLVDKDDIDGQYKVWVRDTYLKIEVERRKNATKNISRVQNPRGKRRARKS